MVKSRPIAEEQNTYAARIAYKTARDVSAALKVYAHVNTLSRSTRIYINSRIVRGSVLRITLIAVTLHAAVQRAYIRGSGNSYGVLRAVGDKRIYRKALSIFSVQPADQSADVALAHNIYVALYSALTGHLRSVVYYPFARNTARIGDVARHVGVYSAISLYRHVVCIADYAAYKGRGLNWTEDTHIEKA